MDCKSYTDEVIAKFVSKYVCQNDNLLKKYLIAGDVKNFQKRLTTHRDADENIKKVVLTMFVNALESDILNIVSNLSLKMKKHGFMVLSGGAAINKYLPFDKHGTVNDIDFKFVPVYKDIPYTNPKYFGYIQITKVHMWNELGKLVKSMSFNKQLFKIIKKIQETNVGKCLGITINRNVPMFKRRYGYIMKKKQSNTREVLPGNVLQDVELMTIDVSGVKFFMPSVKAIRSVNLGGMVDIAILRQGEIGAKILRNTTQGYKSFPHMLVAGKKFIFDDVYLLRKLKLRPNKLQKDRERFVKFAQITANTRISEANSNDEIYRRANNKMWNYDRKLFQKEKITKKNISRISKLNSKKYTKYTVPLSRGKINKVTNPRANKSAKYRFNMNKKEWKINKNKKAIKAETAKNLTRPVLRGYNPRRNRWIPKKIILQAKSIPFVAFKDKVRFSNIQ